MIEVNNKTKANMMDVLKPLTFLNITRCLLGFWLSCIFIIAILVGATKGSISNILGVFSTSLQKKDKTKSRPKTAFLPVALFETLIRIPRLH